VGNLTSDDWASGEVSGLEHFLRPVTYQAIRENSAGTQKLYCWHVWRMRSSPRMELEKSAIFSRLLWKLTLRDWMH